MNGFDSPRSRDPAIKLFGREITLPENQIPAKPKSMEPNFGKMKMDKSMPLPNRKQEQKASTEPRNAQVHNSSNSKEDHQTEADDSEQEKSFKKPDKILPCPRCNSLDTKFCYFNNYNVNQPRYYCKNCQRYWTAGGTMRNVPVGAGRRRNKQFAIASQYRQILDGSSVSKMDSPKSANDQTGTVLKFSSDIHLCESMDSVLQLKDQKKHEKENHQQVSAIGSSSSMVTSIKNNEISQTSLLGSCNNTNTQNSIPFYPVPSWGFSLSPIWNDVATAVQSNGNPNSNAVQFCSGPATATRTTAFPQNIPLQFVPVSYLPIVGNMSWVASNGNSQSAALGKHSREPCSVMEETQSENYNLVPKSLRIDDHPTAVSKSFPVWVATGLGTMSMASKESKGAVFKGSEHKMEETHVLEANPAAFSRSQTFQERT